MGKRTIRTATTIKTLFRSPWKTALTFMLLAAASFTLFSRVTDSVIMSRETANAQQFYHAVAALDNTVPPINSEEGVIYADDKPWPAAGKLEEFASLPGVTLADKRYMTAGLVEDFKRLPADDDYCPYYTGEFVVEGAYVGYESSGTSQAQINLLLKDVTVLAGDISLDPKQPLRISTMVVEGEDSEAAYGYGEMPRSFYDGLDKGTRCLVMGAYNEGNGQGLETANWNKDFFWVVDGLGEGYLETEAFAFQKGVVEAARMDLCVYDIAYTSDMRAIPRFNERSMVIAKGRPLATGDTDACVVSESFLDKNHLSLGDKISIKLGDKLKHQDAWFGTRALVGKDIPDFVKTAELEIVGAYRFTDDFAQREEESVWSYTQSTVFVPIQLLPVEVPDDYTHTAGELSVFVEDAHDIEAFREAVEPLAAETGMGLRFSDGGWMSVKDNFEAGRIASLLTSVLYILGTALALFFAVYLYIGENRKSYAIMRMLGVPGRKAANAIVLPLIALSMLSMPVGGMAGLFYTAQTANQALAGMAANAHGGYTPNVTLPASAVVLCLVFELSFISMVTLLFMRNMKKTPPLGLLQEGRQKTGAGGKRKPCPASPPVTAGFHIAKIPPANGLCGRRTWHMPRQVSSYILRHMRRGIGKTAVSLMLAVVMAAGIGAFALARAAYGDAFCKAEVKGKAAGFASSSIAQLEKSGLADNIYYFNKNAFSVRVNGMGTQSSMAVTNDIERYLGKDGAITYASGYDSSVFEGTGPVCLLGQELAEELGISAGGEITLLTDDLYTFIMELYEDEESLQAAAERAGKPYKVVGIVESKDMDHKSSVFTVANSAAEALYGQPFPAGYCEFTLADNGKLGELNAFLEGQKKQDIKYARMASFYVDASGLENTRRIRDLLSSLFPVALAAAALIGLFGAGLVILQSAKEAALLRILGVTKKRAGCMMALEQVVLCIAAVALVAGALALSDPGRFSRSVQTLVACWSLYLLSCACGALVVSVLVARRKVLELLQVKE